MFELLCLLLTFSGLASSRHGNDDGKCARKLQGIVFEPETYSRQYMAKVAAQFNRGKALLFTSQADSYINSFQQEWGVSITIAEPSNICQASASQLTCFDFGEIFSGGGAQVAPGTENLFTTTIQSPVPYPLVSLELKRLGGSYTGSTPQNFFFAATLVAPDASEAVLVSSSNGCQTQDYDFSMSDAGTQPVGTADGTCAGLSVDPRSNYAPIDAFSTFYGKTLLDGSGNWGIRFNNLGTSLTLVIDEFTLTACYNAPSALGSACSRDVMRSVINVPSYRYDSSSQTVYWTEDVFDSFGNMKQVTISRSVDSLYLKK